MFGGKYLVLWKEAKKDKTDALMRSFDTTIEAKSYIQGLSLIHISEPTRPY